MEAKRLLPMSVLFVLLSSPTWAAEQWLPVPGDARWSGHFVDGVQVGAKDTRSGEYWAYDPRTGLWAKSRAASAGMIASPGLKREMLHGGERFSIDGKPASEWECKAMLASNPAVPGDDDKFSLTVIGSPADRERVARDLLTDPKLQSLRGCYVLQMYEPSDPMIARFGFVTTGTPTIYFQDSDGGVMARSDTYQTPAVLAEGIEKAWRLNVAQRKRDPNYQPDKDTSIIRFARPSWWEWAIVTAICRKLLILVGLSVLVVGVAGFLSGRLSKGKK